MSILLLLAVASISEGTADFAISCFSKAKNMQTAESLSGMPMRYVIKTKK